MIELMAFTGALLSFSMEPLSGRLLIPHFGGAIHVWLTCMMFFQGVLLAGYVYSHFFTLKLGRWHLLLLLLPFINLPFSVTAEIIQENQLGQLLLLLFTRFGLPFFALSTTAVVGQQWLANSDVDARSPYTLYAASNLGSFMGLFGYPLIIEPLFGVKAQTWLWLAGYCLYIALAFTCWRSISPNLRIPDPPSREPVGQTVPRIRDYLIWIILSALPSVLFLSVTNILSLEVGSFPLIWISPLALYLASFIVTFREKPFIPLKNMWPEAVLISLCLYIYPFYHWAQVAGYLFLLLALCLRCHGELYSRRPSVRYLTQFYISISTGGWIGGLFVSVLAPVIFGGLYEYMVSTLLIAAFIWILDRTRFARFWKDAHILKAGLRLLPIAAMFTFLALGARAYWGSEILFRHRNFYGTYKIHDVQLAQSPPSILRKLVHGNTLHGSQLQDPAKKATPTSYYYEGGNIAEVYSTVPSPRNVAILGLGAGAAGVFANANDVVNFYEIDADNERIARQWFSYLDDSKGKINIFVGDARIVLRQQALAGPRFDLIHLDAFTGDGIPIHLLTREAIGVYLKALLPNGILLFHISNRYYDLVPVVVSTASSFGLKCSESPLKSIQIPEWAIPSICVVAARNDSALETLRDKGWGFGNFDGESDGRFVWSDDYINMILPAYLKLMNP